MKTVKLGDICNLKTGGTPSRAHKEYFENGNIKWLVSGDIHKGEIHDCDGRITEDGLKNSNARMLQLNSVMIALNGQGKTRATVAMLRTEATCNQSLVSIYPKDDTKIFPEYIFWNLRGRYDELRKLTGDAGNERRGLNMIIIRNIDIPKPPSIEDQWRVVERLGAAFEKIDQAIEMTQKNIKNINSLCFVITRKMLEQVDGQEKTVGEVIKLEYGKPLDKTDRKVNGKFAAYGANGIKDMTDRYYCDIPSIIVGRKGSAGELTRVDQPFWPLDVTYYVAHDDLETNIDYIFHVLDSLNLQSLARGVKPGINRNDVYALPFTLPDLHEQAMIAKRLDVMRDQSEKLTNQYEKKITTLNALKQSMLEQAFLQSEVE